MTVYGILMFLFSFCSSLEVLLQHLSLQDIDARDNEVCECALMGYHLFMNHTI